MGMVAAKSTEAHVCLRPPAPPLSFDLPGRKGSVPVFQLLLRRSLAVARRPGFPSLGRRRPVRSLLQLRGPDDPQRPPPALEPVFQWWLAGLRGAAVRCAFSDHSDLRVGRRSRPGGVSSLLVVPLVVRRGRDVCAVPRAERTGLGSLADGGELRLLGILPRSRGASQHALHVLVRPVGSLARASGPSHRPGVAGVSGGRVVGGIGPERQSRRGLPRRPVHWPGLAGVAAGARRGHFSCALASLRRDDAGAGRRRHRGARAFVSEFPVRGGEFQRARLAAAARPGAAGPLARLSLADLLFQPADRRLHLGLPGLAGGGCFLRAGLLRSCAPGLRRC